VNTVEISLEYSPIVFGGQVFVQPVELVTEVDIIRTGVLRIKNGEKNIVSFKGSLRDRFGYKGKEYLFS